MSGILLLLGTNLGDRLANLQKAKGHLLGYDIQIVKESSVYESEPWGKSDQPYFLNMVLEVETKMNPHELLDACLSIETEMGRQRKEKWGERLIDIDILLYEDQIINDQSLQIPHPGIPDRRFTLMPLAEKWGEMEHPGGQRIRTLLEKCGDRLSVKKTTIGN